MADHCYVFLRLRYPRGGLSSVWLAFWAVGLSALPVLALTQQRGTPKPGAAAARTTMSGVYSSAQAGRGEETFMGICVGCHPVATYTGANFNKSWGGRPLWDLYDWISNKMPKNDPGSLSPPESAQVMAYLLKMNDIPAGKAELQPDPAMLRRIRIETPTMKPKTKASKEQEELTR
jgi:mono/diheme cytochrome c family protein